jgi:hypothetical protein
MPYQRQAEKPDERTRTLAYSEDPGTLLPPVTPLPYSDGLGIVALVYGALDTLLDRMQRVQTFTLLTWPDDSMTLTF